MHCTAYFFFCEGVCIFNFLPDSQFEERNSSDQGVFDSYGLIR